MGFAVGLSEEGKEEGAGKVVKHWRGFSVDQPLAVQVVVAGAADHLSRNTVGESVHQSNA